MADKAISDLLKAEQIKSTDMFVLEQDGTAKNLTGQVLLNWLTAAADGHGGIQKIEKTRTSGLVDTYTITLADTTMQTFTVTNGEKGDKGDNAYVWVKYASVEPKSPSTNLSDIPDKWMGIYTGGLSSAPNDYTQYKWFEIKGAKGDTGAPATLVSSTVGYMVSDSGVNPPEGSWSADIPNVPQGKYLWTRIINSFNTGSEVTSYSVSRMGIDGTGSVKTVNGIDPDSDGDVSINHVSVGAAPNGYGLGDSIGNSNYTNANSMLYNGWYNCENISGTPTTYGWMHVSARSTNYVWQEFYSATTEIPTKVSRCKINGTWSEWEWENPPLAQGVEYLTTERFNGKPVYKKLISFGALPNASTAYAQGCFPSAARDITLKGYAHDSATGNMYEPLQWPIIKEIWAVGDSTGYIGLETADDRSAWQAMIIASYTKQ